jgi:hypothetical protein
VSLAEVVDVNPLWKTVAAAIVAGVGVVLLFSLTVLGAVRGTEASRAGRPVATVAYGAMAIAGLAATGGAIALGLIVMSQK